MSTLTRKQIIKRIDDIGLITEVRKKNGRDGNEEYDVEGASYDLSVGIAVSKKAKDKIFQKRVVQYTFNPNGKKQETITLGPGQMAYVITYEEIRMPFDLCGTVYSRNSLALKGILALNAGHIDPGYNGPIIIKLINLRSIDYTLKMGEPIFTITFHDVEDNESEDDKSRYGRTMTKEESLKRVVEATDLSLNNALYDLTLLREFVKEDEFGRAFRKWITKSTWRIVTTIFAFLITLITAGYALYKISEMAEKYRNQGNTPQTTTPQSKVPTNNLSPK